jgi:hypothetical protein
LLPTDKPSRLHEFGGVWLTHKEPTECFRNYNIYITDDSEIKEGDWVLNTNTNTTAKYTGHGSMDWWVKIILTTDQDLIKDGVQAIDDDFLQWFVNNPSCESVEVKNYKFSEYPLNYKIIIPKEEPKQETLSYTEAAKKDERIFNSTMTKQETIEEAAFENSVDYKPFEDNLNPKQYYEQGFINGAKWQAERMYSESQVIILLNKFGSKVYGDYTRNETMEDFCDKWFEQNKKK